LIQTESAAKDPFDDLSRFTASRFIGTPPKVEFLVQNSIEQGIPVITPAMGDTGKSFLILELCRRVAFGSSALSTPPIFGGQVVQEGSAVFLTSEDGEHTVHRRLNDLDPEGARHAKKGEKLIVLPLPDHGGAKPFWKEIRNRGLEETDYMRRFQDSLRKIPDLKLVCIDPLASFAQLPINEDPAAGQFVCTSLTNLAAETGATVITTHHMRKSQKAVESLSEARDSIRGTTALVDGMRAAYALWPIDEGQARRICKELKVPFAPNKVVRGGMVKSNGPVHRTIATYVRNDFGLLVDRTADISLRAPNMSDQLGALIAAIGRAAADGQPFTKTGQNGLYERREVLPTELKKVSKHKFGNLVQTLLDSRSIVQAMADGSKVIKWLDVPDGNFAKGIGQFRVGAARGDTLH
jgi:hypothetical protein